MVMSDNRPNVVCPHPGCNGGSRDTGGFTPWGAAITEVCITCAGHGFVTAEEYDKLKATEYEHTICTGIRMTVKPWLGAPYLRPRK